MSRATTITILFIAVIFTGVIVYDIIVYANNTAKDTITWVRILQNVAKWVPYQ